jgi:hypothetical protein
MQILCGQTVMFPVILDPKILDPPFEVGVHICPILASNGDHLVFVGKGKVPQVRSGLQPVGLAMRELTVKEIADRNLAPPLTQRQTSCLIFSPSR